MPDVTCVGHDSQEGVRGVERFPDRQISGLRFDLLTVWKFLSMTTRRTARVGSAIRQVVSNAILFGLRDPRVTGVTVLNVEVAPDLRTAKVYISILADEKKARLTLMGLDAARGWIQSRIVDELQLRLTPVLSFVVDPGIKKSIEVAKLLREIQPPPEETEPEGEELDEESASSPDVISEESSPDEDPGESHEKE